MKTSAVPLERRVIRLFGDHGGSMCENEQWKDVVGFEGYYKVSTFGRVRSVARIVWAGNRSFTVRDRILKCPPSNGRTVLLQIEGYKKSKRIGRLVWETFVGEIPNDLLVLHKNGNENDCALENLILGSQCVAETMKLERGDGTRNRRVVDAYWSTSGDGKRVLTIS